MKTWWLSSTLLPLAALFANEPSQNDPNSNIYSEVDYLFWSSTQSDLHSPTVATGQSPNLDPKWSSGVRLVMGGQAAKWNIEADYIYYSTSSHDTASANIGTILSSTPSTAGVFNVSENWKLSFNRIDLMLSQKLLGDSFILEPFFGLEGIDMAQKFDLVTKTTFIDLTTGLQATNVVDSENKNTFLALGPKGGFKTSYDFKNGFGFYGNLGVNLLLGKFKIKQDYNETDFYSATSSTVLADQVKQNSQDGCIFNADLELGMSWKYQFEKNNLGLTVKAGWEEHYYSSIVRFQDFYLQQTSLGTAAYTTNGNLTLSGLIFGVLLNY